MEALMEPPAAESSQSRQGLGCEARTRRGIPPERFLYLTTTGRVSGLPRTIAQEPLAAE
jgi:hypothetical protein